MYFSPLAMRELLAGPRPADPRAAAALLPGPVTLVVANPQRRYPLACREDPERLGVRLIAGPLAGAMCPLFQTSANRSGEPAPASFAEVPAEIVAGADLAIDGGALTGLPSTVVDLTAFDESRRVADPPRGRAAAAVAGDSASQASAALAAVGEADEAAGCVVALVRLVEEVLRVDGHDEGEAAAQAADSIHCLS